VKLAVLALLGFVGGSVQSHSGRLPRTTDIPTFTAHEGLVFANGDGARGRQAYFYAGKEINDPVTRSSVSSLQRIV